MVYMLRSKVTQKNYICGYLSDYRISMDVKMVFPFLIHTFDAT